MFKASTSASKNTLGWRTRVDFLRQAVFETSTSASKNTLDWGTDVGILRQVKDLAQLILPMVTVASSWDSSYWTGFNYLSKSSILSMQRDRLENHDQLLKQKQKYHTHHCS